MCIFFNFGGNLAYLDAKKGEKIKKVNYANKCLQISMPAT